MPSLRTPRLATALVAFAIAATALTGCGNSDTSCALDGCRVSFPRSGEAAVSVLGVEARLVGVQMGQVTIDVAGNVVTVPVGGEQQADGFTVAVESVTDTDVVVRISA